MHDGAPRGVLSSNLICMISMMVWAAALPAGDHLVPLVPALPLAMARISVAAIALCAIWAVVEGPRALLRADWARAVAIGGGTIGVGAVCLVVSQRMTDGVTVAIISASMPIVGMLVEVALDGRRITPALLLGLFLSLAGAAVALWATPSEGMQLGWGALILLFSVVTYTVGSRLTVTSFPGLTPLGQTSVTVTGAAVPVIAASLLAPALGGTAADWSALGAWDWGALAYYGIGGLAIAQVLWIMAVGRLGIGVATLHMNATPFYVMLLLFALGEDWIWSRAVGAAIVGLGVLVAQGVIPLRSPRHA